jgi:hypothetical protein
VLGHKGASLNYRFMRCYNRRFKTIALARRRLGAEGRRNHGRRLKPYFALDWAPFRMTLRGLRMWALAELDLLRLRAAGLFRRTPVTSGASPHPALSPGGGEGSKGGNSGRQTARKLHQRQMRRSSARSKSVSSARFRAGSRR